jgi:hypothetical protein
MHFFKEIAKFTMVEHKRNDGKTEGLRITDFSSVVTNSMEPGPS